MITKIDGKIYADLVSHGIKNLEKHRDVLNRLNVFPVPDGDTGTNMLMTLRCGQNEMASSSYDSLPDTAMQFSSAAVFGARGNSGVIVSQFFKGVSEVFKDSDEAGPALLSIALESGTREAYASVVNPVEGTMLTVLKDASAAVMLALPLQSIDEVIDVYLDAARRSLANTPELLPILKKANVVDSGGSGVVYFFEGVQKYLRGEEIATDAEISEQKGSELPFINPSMFNKQTEFRYGYCVEGLLQLTDTAEPFSYSEFNAELSKLGSSLVSSVETDKVKIHIHSKFPGNIINFCQRFGELLTIKIENMTVQNTNRELREKEHRKFLCSPEESTSEFAVVAVASTELMQQMFIDMGADVVILSEIAPSSQDFMDAFGYISAKKILVFPNGSNSILTSMQAGSLYKNAKVSVVNSRSVAECYAALAVLDFGGTIDEAITLVNDTIANVRQVFLYHAENDIKYGSRTILQNDFFALQGKKILAVDTTLEEVALRAVEKKLRERDASVITVFYGQSLDEDSASHLADEIGKIAEDAEVATVSTMDTVYDVTIIFE